MLKRNGISTTALAKEFGYSEKFLNGVLDGRIEKYYKGRIADDDLAGWEQRARTGRLVDIRDTIAHTNEVQIAVSLESLPHFFNDAMFLLRHLTFIKRETAWPTFIEYDFKLFK